MFLIYPLLALAWQCIINTCVSRVDTPELESQCHVTCGLYHVVFGETETTGGIII